MISTHSSGRLTPADELAAVADRALHLAQPDARRGRRAGAAAASGGRAAAGRLIACAPRRAGRRRGSARARRPPGRGARGRSATGTRSRGSAPRPRGERMRLPYAARKASTNSSSEASGGRVSPSPRLARRSGIAAQDLRGGRSSRGTTRSSCWPWSRFSAVGRVDREDLAVVDDADPVAALDLLDVVRGDQHGQLAARRAGGEIVPDPRRAICASSPTVGSSRNRIAESWISARAISSRRFMPEDRVRTSLSRPVGQFHQLQHLVDPLPPQRPRHAVDQAVEVEILAHRQPVVEARLLEDDADGSARRRVAARPRRAADRAGRCPGGRIVHRMWSSVVLPAPLGPSSANSSRRGTSKLTSSSASVRP